MNVFFQPEVTPLPKGIDLDGKTFIITGANKGMGLEAARQILARNSSTVILAVGNIIQGHDCRNILLADRAVTSLPTKPTVKVMKLDMNDYDSVRAFAKAIKTIFPIVDHLLLNHEIGTLKFKRNDSGHERTMQVNYLSNVLLLLELLPHLEASAMKTGSPSRVTWVGSCSHLVSTLTDNGKEVKPEETVIGHMNDRKYFFPFKKYNDTKLLCVMFLYKLAPRLDKSKVIFNMMCPGTIAVPWRDVLPIYHRTLVHILNLINVRSLEKAAWIILNALLVVGPESHGKFMLDKDIQP